MLSRRDLIFSGTLASSLHPADARAAQRSSQDDRQEEAQALREIRDALLRANRLTPSADIADIREKMRQHFRLNQKFPDYIDIGIQVWDRLYTWHLENRDALKVSRTPEGRMEMEFMFTTLLLRGDYAENGISVPYDR
jgi:hypothetical protein